MKNYISSFQFHASEGQRMPVTIHATEKALFKIFNNDFAFAIPPYQRPYAWTTDQASELALLSRKKNAEAQNYDFDKKKEKYFATKKGVSPFVLTTQVLQRAEWTPAIVNQRQQELLQRLKTLWRL